MLWWLRPHRVHLFFQSYESHIDGGIIATDPSLASIIYAIDEDLGKKIKSIRLLSFGTGYCYDSIKEDTSKWGALEWVTSKDPDLPIITVTLEGISQVSQIFSKKLLDEILQADNSVQMLCERFESASRKEDKTVSLFCFICLIHFVIKWDELF